MRSTGGGRATAVAGTTACGEAARAAGGAVATPVGGTMRNSPDGRTKGEVATPVGGTMRNSPDGHARGPAGAGAESVQGMCPAHRGPADAGARGGGADSGRGFAAALAGQRESRGGTIGSRAAPSHDAGARKGPASSVPRQPEGARCQSYRGMCPSAGQGLAASASSSDDDLSSDSLSSGEEPLGTRTRGRPGVGGGCILQPPSRQARTGAASAGTEWPALASARAGTTGSTSTAGGNQRWAGRGRKGRSEVR